MAISTTYGPGSMTTQTDLALGGGGGGGGGGGFDNELVDIYRRRARESEADRARQRAMDRQRFEWEKMSHQMADPRNNQLGQANNPAALLNTKRQGAEEMELDAATRTPQRELQLSRPGVIGGYGGPDISNMNAISRQLYAPKESTNQGFVGSAPGSERVDIDPYGGSRLVNANTAQQLREQNSVKEQQRLQEMQRENLDRLQLIKGLGR